MNSTQKFFSTSFYERLRRNPRVRQFYFRLPLKIRRIILLRYFTIGEALQRRTRTESPTWSSNLFWENYLESISEVPPSASTSFNLTEKSRARSPFTPQDTLVFEIEEKSFDLMSVDFWDTLVVRTRPAESSKILSALRASFAIWKSENYSTLRLREQDLYQQRVILESKDLLSSGETSIHRTMHSLLSDYLSISQISELIEAEITDEITFSFINQLLEARLLEIDTKKIVVSDFYMDGEALKRIYNALGGKITFEAFHSSSDYGKTKRNNGELFSYLSLSGSRWMHIGDNSWSDVEMPRKRGGLATKVSFSSTLQKTRCITDFEDYSSVDLLDSKISNPDKYLVEMSIIAYSLITRAIEVALASDKQKVIYLSREGSTLAKFHNVFNKHMSAVIGANVEALHLPISRSSSLLCSFADSPDLGLNYISSQYPLMDVDSIIATFGLDDQHSQLIRSEINPFEKIPTNLVWSQLSSSARNRICQYLRNQRTLLATYMDTLNVSSENSVLCDLGWRGTIQDAVERIQLTDYIGVYLGLWKKFPSQVASPRPGMKIGVLWDEPANILAPHYLKLLGPIERGFTLDSAQIHNYRVCSNAEIRPEVRDSETSECFSLRRQYFGRRYEEVAENVAITLLANGLFSTGAIELAHDTLQNWYLKPSVQQADLWFLEGHTEGFGVGNRVHYINKLPDQTWTGKSLQTLVLKYAEQSLWPEGYLASSPIVSLLCNHKKEDDDH